MAPHQALAFFSYSLLGTQTCPISDSQNVGHGLCLYNQIVGIFCMVFSFRHTLQSSSKRGELLS
jgi:hypothetical protein